MKEKKPTEREWNLIQCYRGNIEVAAREAGYASVNTAKNALKKPHVYAALKKAGNYDVNAWVMNREARQKFWTEMINDKTAKVADRLKASELLGKSEADFTDKVLVGSLEEELKKIDDEDLIEQIKQFDPDAETILLN